MCSSEEQAFKWVRTLLLRFERRSVGVTSGEEGGPVNGVKMKMDLACTQNRRMNLDLILKAYFREQKKFV